MNIFLARTWTKITLKIRPKHAISSFSRHIPSRWRGVLPCHALPLLQPNFLDAPPRIRRKSMSQIHVSGHGGGGWIGIVSGVRGSQSGWEGRISVERETARERERELESGEHGGDDDDESSSNRRRRRQPHRRDVRNVKTQQTEG